MSHCYCSCMLMKKSFWLSWYSTVFNSLESHFRKDFWQCNPSLWYSIDSFEYKDRYHYEPPGQNISIVSQICLILVSNCLKRSKFCLKHVSDKMSQFGLNLRPFWHLRYNWDCPYLRAIWDIFLRCQKSVKKVSKMSQKGIWGGGGI